MHTSLKSLIALAAVGSSIALAGCSTEEEDAATTSTSSASSEAQSEHGEAGAHHHHSDGGPAPAGIIEANNPKFPLGSEVTLTAGHMPGMEGAPATIVGAYQTTAYEVSYTPVDGGEPVNNHKWVVQQEIQDAGKEPLADGTEVTLTADHMPGMKGAQATIDSSTDETVYIVDVNGEEMQMKNHKWMVESEMEA